MSSGYLSGPLGSGGGAYVGPVTPPVPAATLDYWLSEDINPATKAWPPRGNTGGPTLNAATTPGYGADPGYGNGINAGLAYLSPAGGWKSAAGSNLFVIGQRPYVAAVVRFRGVPPVNAFYAAGGCGIHGVSQGMYFWLNQNVGSSWRASQNSGTATIGAVADDQVHFWEVWGDGTNYNLSLDGVITARADVAALTTNVTQISVGVSPSSNIHYSDSSHWFHMWCPSVPTVPERAALRLWARSKYQF